MNSIRKPLLLGLLAFSNSFLFSQTRELPVLFISSMSALHLRSPEPISYVDLPLGSIKGDLPLKNLLRIRLTKDSSTAGRTNELGVLTVTGERFLAQYRLIRAAPLQQNFPSEIEILPTQMVPLFPSDQSFSTAQIKQKCLDLLSVKIKKPQHHSSTLGLSIEINQIKSAGDLVFLDLSLNNSTQVSFDIHQISFTISDKKISQAANFQQFALEPRFILFSTVRLAKRLRNIYVLPKAIFASSKQLLIGVSEKQPSSREISLALDYGDLLSADSF